MSTREYIPTKDVAKLIRAELAKVFPGVKFSVRTQQYSMGSHVNVHWTDGPARWHVDAAIGHFCGTGFDGMTDSTTHHDTEYKGQMVHFGGSMPSCDRHETDFDGWKAAALAFIRERCVLENDGKQFGNRWVDDIAASMAWAADMREPQPVAIERAYRRIVLREDTP